MIFVGGAIFSIAQGLSGPRSGGAEHNLQVGYIVLAVALAAEGKRSDGRSAPNDASGARIGKAARPVRARKMETAVGRWSGRGLRCQLRASSSRSPGSCSLQVTHNRAWDAIASIAIEPQSSCSWRMRWVETPTAALIGEAATAEDPRGNRARADRRPAVVAVWELLTMQLGPGGGPVRRRQAGARGGFHDVSRARHGRASAGASTARIDTVRQVFIDPTPAMEAPAVAGVA